MQRPSWEGHLKLSLVSCPVALFSATTRGNDVSFHLIHKKTHSRIRMVPHDPKLGAMKRTDLQRGFDVGKNRYVILSKAEIEAARIESTKNIDIESFVEMNAIDRVYWDQPYYVAPNGRNAMEAYAIIREAMEKTQRIAIGRVVMHTRERVVAVEPRGRGLLLTTLRSHDEIREEDSIFRGIPARKPDRKMLAIAEKIIDQQAEAFDPADFTDRYEDALRKIIRRKQKGQKITAKPVDEDKAEDSDLLAALRRSLKGGGDTGGKKTTRRKTARRKTASPRARTRAKAKRPTRRRAAA
ncbi:MAG: Ku protein [Ferrovibrio sp.]|uniref:non-homologous end joining protein Ku n=1 Tax=Ferrovibrio sp. TaxID=1917215 RepID=UPI00260DB120|nr:Ku protein [Ferrovibrio sp.]MCW0233817.1 Ku protein [Ferrovibrio sp.]